MFLAADGVRESNFKISSMWPLRRPTRRGSAWARIASRSIETSDPSNEMSDDGGESLLSDVEIRKWIRVP